mgnify:FL=1
MRKITQDAIRAFYEKKDFKRGNTQVIAGLETVNMYLHGNLIVRATPKGLWINDGGHQSNTTKERLNGLPNVNVHQKNWQWFLNGEAWNGNEIKVMWGSAGINWGF